MPQRRKHSNAQRKLLSLLTITLFAGTIFFLVFSENFRIQKIIIERKGSFVEIDSFKKISAPFLRKNIFLFDTEILQKKIITAHPEIQQIAIKKQIPSSVKISLIAYPVVANLTNTFGDFKKKFQINEKGVLVTENKENATLPYLKMSTEKSLVVGKEIIDKKNLDFTLESIHMFEEIFAMKVVDALYKPIEREVHLRTEKGFMVWLDTQKDLKKQFEKLKRALSNLDIYNTPLEYIDLRIPGIENEKIFYKRK
ncbi:hypothetical protein HZA41_02100 [Candidatus Peregrinibacteria bacterium]|nr:hypothetical protein [Candidatus Peregrinibacteria bacterium]